MTMRIGSLVVEVAVVIGIGIAGDGGRIDVDQV